MSALIGNDLAGILIVAVRYGARMWMRGVQTDTRAIRWFARLSFASSRGERQVSSTFLRDMVYRVKGR